ncbi:MAG: TonB-dependent receptor plug domain-containing protein, partial [Muribaculaceae bacterium]|nr:TonB-dependent receptor plug domain-containing protein [Muribaculaceae bacterium]
INETPSTTVAGALQGKMAGLMVTPSGKPGEDATVRVRGTNTINSGSSPIFVIDGLVMDGDFGSFNSINPEDVESIQVLKDASATALYGSRGANGVILITTKKGSKGEGKVTYDGWVQTSYIAHRPKTMNARQLGDLRIDAFANGYIHSNPGADRNVYIQNALLGTNTAFSSEELATYNSGDSYDWLDRFTQTGVTQSHTLSFSNGGEKYNLFASFNYSGTKGITIGTQNNRYSGRGNADSDIKPWLRIGTNTQFSRTDDKMPVDEVFNQAMAANPLLNPAPYQNPETRYTYDYLTLYYRAHTEGNNNDYNPYNSLEVDQKRVRDRLISSNYININPIEGLNIRSTFAFDLANQTWLEYTPDYVQQAIRHYNGDARAKHERWTKLSWQWDNTATYRRTFADVHNTDFLIGTSASRNTFNYTKAQGDRFASNDLGFNDLGG